MITNNNNIYSNLWIWFICILLKKQIALSVCNYYMYMNQTQGRAEDFRIGVALTLIAREIFLSATPIFRLLVWR